MSSELNYYSFSMKIERKTIKLKISAGVLTSIQEQVFISLQFVNIHRRIFININFIYTYSDHITDLQY